MPVPTELGELSPDQTVLTGRLEGEECALDLPQRVAKLLEREGDEPSSRLATTLGNLKGRNPLPKYAIKKTVLRAFSVRIAPN